MTQSRPILVHGTIKHATEKGNMDSGKLNDWLQVVGLFGVIASLIFVGLQMKQEQSIARSAASQARTDATNLHMHEVLSNPSYMSAIDKLSWGEDLLPSEEAARH